MNVDGLISTIVAIYLVASVIGAVLKRLQQRSTQKEPLAPAGRGQPRPAEETVDDSREVVVLGIPYFPSETQEPMTGERRLIEVGGEVREGLSESQPDVANDSALDMAAEEETVDLDAWSTLEDEPDRAQRHFAHRDLRGLAARTVDSTEVKAKSPYWVASTTEWRRAVVLAEVLNKPRGLRPYRPVGKQ